MNDFEQPLLKEPPSSPVQPTPDRDVASPLPNTSSGYRRSGRRLLGAGVLVLFISALALGVWRHYQ